MKRLIISLLLFGTVSFAQVDTVWTKTFGGEFEDRGYGIVQSNDGGYVIAGRKGKEDGWFNAWIIKTDSEGNEEWNIEIGDSLINTANSIIKTYDGNFVVAVSKNGTSWHPSNFSSSSLMKIDNSGNTIWEVTYPDSIARYIWKVQSTPDSGFVFTGDEYLVKTDSLGNLLWYIDELGQCLSVTAVSDGGIILTTTFGGGFGGPIIKYNEDGVEVWDNNDVGFEVWSMIETPSGFLGVGTNYESGFAVALSLSGETLPAENDDYYIFDVNSTWLFDIIQSNDGGYYVSGNTNNDGTGEDLMIIKMAGYNLAEPEISWTSTFGGESSDRAYGMVLSDDGSLVVTGRTESFGNGENDVWLLKMGPAGPPPPPPTIVINEFLALNGSCCTDAGGDNDDYIELYNYGDSEANIAGCFITDDIDNQQNYYQIPYGDNSTIIQPGGYLLLWADNETGQGVLHLGIKLNGMGEQIGLFMQNGTLLDTITFGLQDTDISYGRYPDGAGNWGFMNPTPDASNTETLTIEKTNSIPKTFTLHQNYPNPFNPVTTLHYDLPENSYVNVTVYDMLGREVRTLVNTTQDAGFKSVIWDATNDYGKPVSAGVYLCQIRASDYVQTKKMVLLK